MELWLVRHGKAGEAGAAGPDDRRRPLTRAGREQAQRLARLLGRLGIDVDRVFTSPLARATQTAEPLEGLLRKGRSVEVLEALARPGPEGVVAALKEVLTGDEARVICVGHAPQMAELTAMLIGAPASGATVEVKKATAVRLEGELRAGGMALRALLPARIVEALDPLDGEGGRKPAQKP